MMNNRVELMDEEVELVNGGFDFGDIINTVRKKVNEVTDYISDKTSEAVDIVKKKIDEVIKNVDPIPGINPKIPMIPMTLPR